MGLPRVARGLKAVYTIPFASGTQNNYSRSFATGTVDASEVQFSKVDDCGVIQLNKPKSLNSLSLNMVRLMHEKLKQWKDEHVKLVICKGGEKAFCAGGDIVAIYKNAKNPESTFEDDFFRGEYTLDYQIGTLGIPYIALIHGITMGGGVGISVHGKYRVATEKTMFAMPETAIGFFVDVGGSYFLPRLPGQIGTYLALTGTRLTGKDVKLGGVATHFVDSELLPALEKDLLAIKNPTSENVNDMLCNYEKKGVAQKGHEFSLSRELDSINNIFKANTMEEIIRRLEKENSEWSRKTLSTIRTMSPTSLKIALRQMQEGRSKSLSDCFKMEFRVSQRILQGNDFYEGVRAKLLDKDNQPRWKPPTVEEVNDADVDAHFVPFTNPSKELAV